MLPTVCVGCVVAAPEIATYAPAIRGVGNTVEASYQHWNDIRVKDRRIQDTTFTASYYD